MIPRSASSLSVSTDNSDIALRYLMWARNLRKIILNNIIYELPVGDIFKYTGYLAVKHEKYAASQHNPAMH